MPRRSVTSIGVRTCRRIPGLADAQEWLKRIAMAVLAGKITHHQANAASKALKTWLDAEGARLDVADVEELQKIAKQLKGKGGGRKLRVAR